MLVGLASVLSIPAATLAQGTASTPAPAPLQMSSLDSATKADPFPPVNPEVLYGYYAYGGYGGQLSEVTVGV